MLFRIALMPALVTLAVAHGSAAVGQEYKSDTPDADSRRGRELRQLADAAARTPGQYAQTRAQVDEYFTKFYFPAMTSAQPDDLARLGALRYDLFKKYLWGTNDEAMQRGLTELTYAAMVNIVRPQQPSYHPAVRYNAILTLGMLDEQYAREGANAREPKPLAKSNKLLTSLINTATTQSIVIPPVILGAVIGMERHAQLHASLDPASIQAMTSALLKLVNHAQPIQEMDRAAYSWLQLRAASALASLGTVGENHAIHDGLIHLISNLRSLDDRCTTISLLAKIKYDDAEVASAATAEALFAVARDLANSESKRAKEFQDAQIGVGPAIGARAPMFDPTGMAQQETFPRRQVLDRLADLKAGLQAVKPVLSAEDQTRLDAVVAAVNPVITAATDKTTVELGLTQAIVAMAQAIERAIPAPAQAAPAP